MPVGALPSRMVVLGRRRGCTRGAQGDGDAEHGGDHERCAHSGRSTHAGAAEVRIPRDRLDTARTHREHRPVAEGPGPQEHAAEPASAPSAPSSPASAPRAPVRVGAKPAHELARLDPERRARSHDCRASPATRCSRGASSAIPLRPIPSRRQRRRRPPRPRPRAASSTTPSRRSSPTSCTAVRCSRRCVPPPVPQPEQQRSRPRPGRRRRAGA